VLLQSTTLISVFSIRAGQTTTLYNTPEGGSTSGTITEPGTTLAAPTANYAAFDYPAVVPVDTTVNVELQATVALDYVLQLNGGRRLLRKMVNMKLNQPRALLQADGDSQETERTAEAPYTALNIKLDGSNVRANADGTYSVIVGRIILSNEPTVEEAIAFARITGEQIEAHLGFGVSANVLRVQGSSVIVSLAHDESKTSLLKEHITDANSDLNTKMRNNVQFEFDPEYFFEGDVESTNFQKPASSDDDSNLPAIIGGVAGAAVCCGIILFFLIKKRNDDDSEDDVVKPNGRHSQVSVNDVVIEDTEAYVSTPVRRLSWISRQECAPETAASVASSVVPMSSNKADGTVVVNLA